MSTALAILALAALGRRGRLLRAAQLRLLREVDGAEPAAPATPFYYTFGVAETQDGRVPMPVQGRIAVARELHDLHLLEDSYRIVTTAVVLMAWPSPAIPPCSICRAPTDRRMADMSAAPLRTTSERTRCRPMWGLPMADLLSDTAGFSARAATWARGSLQSARTRRPRSSPPSQPRFGWRGGARPRLAGILNGSRQSCGARHRARRSATCVERRRTVRDAPRAGAGPRSAAVARLRCCRRLRTPTGLGLGTRAARVRTWPLVVGVRGPAARPGRGRRCCVPGAVRQALQLMLARWIGNIAAAAVAEQWAGGALPISPGS